MIKIEPPVTGDPLHKWRLLHDGTSVWWAAQSRNKKSVTLDLKSPEGQEMIRKLALHSDILIENFRPGTMEGWGLGWEELHKLNPRLVMLRVSGYGQTGPYRDRPGFGVVGEAMGGLCHLSGEPGRTPVRVGISIGDSLSALHGVSGILLALRHREQNGGAGQLQAVINPTHFDFQSLRIPYDALRAQQAHLRTGTYRRLPLFVRQPRGLELTASGHHLVQHARSVLNTVNRMAGEMSDFAIGVRGHVRIWANTSAIIQFLPRDLATFLHAQPRIRVSLEEKLSTDVIAAVGSGEADVGIFADNVPAPDLDKFLYRQDHLVVLVPPDHPLAPLTEVGFSDTLDYDFVGLNQGSSLLQRLTDAVVALDKALRLRVRVSSFDGICRMIEAGLGVGVLPAGAVRAEILGAGLRVIRLTDPWAARTLWLGVKSVSGLLPEAAKLLTHLRHSDRTEAPS